MKAQPTIEDLYSAPIGAAIWDHHYGPPESLRDYAPKFIHVPESLIPCLPDDKPRSNKIVYKAGQDDRTITLSAIYDGRGILISFEL